MTVPPSAKRPGGYEHRFHAGNAADVFKHVALVAALERLRVDGRTVRYVETHAGAGRYHLGPDGEWRDGVGRLLPHLDEPDVPVDVTRYATLLDARPSKKGVRYLGSPLLAAKALDAGREEQRLWLYELDEGASSHLEAALARFPAARVVVGDGVDALARGLPAVDEEGDAELFVLIDPPWVEKAEWTKVPDAVVACAKARPRARFALWYPVKSLTRPNAMMQRLAEQGLSALVVELSPSPTAVSKGRLVGSGIVWVRPPAGLVEDLARVAAWLGPRLATTKDAWSLRVTSWTGGVREGAARWAEGR